MAKSAMVQRQLKREKLVVKYAAKRAALKEIANNQDLPMEERFKARLSWQNFHVVLQLLACTIAAK